MRGRGETGSESHSGRRGVKDGRRKGKGGRGRRGEVKGREQIVTQ